MDKGYANPQLLWSAEQLSDRLGDEHLSAWVHKYYYVCSEHYL